MANPRLLQAIHNLKISASSSTETRTLAAQFGAQRETPRLSFDVRERLIEHDESERRMADPEGLRGPPKSSIPIFAAIRAQHASDRAQSVYPGSSSVSRAVQRVKYSPAVDFCVVRARARGRQALQK